MAKIQINEFKGIMPKVANDKLPINMAQTADDIKTASGELRAFKRSTADTALPGSAYQSVFEYIEGGNNHWVYYDLIVHWVRSPIANDAFERMYVTGIDSVNGKYAAFVNDLQGVGTFDFTTDFYYPGAPSAAALTATYTNGGTDYRAYFYTYVSRYGEEGPPSAIMETVDVSGDPDWDGTSSIVLDNFTEPAAADEHLKTVVGSNAPAIRIYRTSTDGAGNAAFLLVEEVPVDNTGPNSTAWASYTYTDTDDAGQDGNLGSACESALYDRAPDDLTGLRGHPGGWFVAHKDNVLYFSESFKPWAWPTDYQIPLDHEIVGVGIFGSTIVVATDGWCYTFTGPHPTSLYKTKLAFQPCQSQRAVVETDTGVMFPSSEGFQHVTPAGITNVTQETFRPEDWDTFELDAMHATWYHKAYYGFYSTADYEGHVIIDFLNGSITTGVKYHEAGYVSIVDGIFYTVVNSDIDDPATLYISKWDADPTSYRNYGYKSPRFILEKPKNFKVAQVIIDSDFYDEVVAIIEADNTLASLNNAAWTATTWGEEDLFGPINGSMINEQDINGDNLFSLSSLGVQNYVEFKVYADGVLKFTKQIMDSNMFKLPRGFKDKKWEIEISGMIPVKRVTLATSTEEIV
jgi:hypothetical protein